MLERLLYVASMYIGPVAIFFFGQMEAVYALTRLWSCALWSDLTSLG